MASSKIYERFGLSNPNAQELASGTATVAVTPTTEVQTEAIDFEDIEKALVVAHIGAFSASGAVTLTIEGGSTSVASDHSTLTGVAGVSSASASASVGSSSDAQDIIIEVHSSLLNENSAKYMSASLVKTGADNVAVSLTVLTEEHSLPSGESVDLEATVSPFS